MALSETLSETSICNQALGRIGSLRIEGNVETEDSVPAIQCRLHYEQTRDALLRTHKWRFASARSELTQGDDPKDFEWDNQFALPDDFVRFKSMDEEQGFTSRRNRHAIEGQRILTNFSSVSLLYIKKVTDVLEFEPLFITALVLFLADRLIGSLAGGDARIQKKIDDAIAKLVPKLQAVDSDERDVGGRSDWNLARHGGIGISGIPERLL